MAIAGMKVLDVLIWFSIKYGSFHPHLLFMLGSIPSALMTMMLLMCEDNMLVSVALVVGFD